MSSPWIKICGLRDAATVAHCLALQVDAVGFVFAPSVRQVSIAEALRLADMARGRAQVVAVLRGASPHMEQIIKEFDPDLLQIDQTAIDANARPMPRGWLPVFRDGEGLPDRLPDRVLFEGRESGVGQTANWREAASLAHKTRLVLAGGLTPDNVVDAITQVRPYGVDVSSGVERERGIKCPAKIKDFVMAVRATASAARECG